MLISVGVQFPKTQFSLLAAETCNDPLGPIPNIYLSGHSCRRFVEMSNPMSHAGLGINCFGHYLFLELIRSLSVLSNITHFLAGYMTLGKACITFYYYYITMTAFEQ